MKRNREPSEEPKYLKALFLFLFLIPIFFYHTWPLPAREPLFYKDFVIFTPSSPFSFQRLQKKGKEGEEGDQE